MSSGKLTSREREVLVHIGRYRFTFQEIVGHVFCEGKSPQKLLDGLRQRGLIEARSGYGGNRRAYKLTPVGATAARLKVDRAKELGSESFPAHLSILAYCFLMGERRARMERPEFAELFHGQVPQGRYHALANTPRGVRVAKLYVPADSTEPAGIVARVQESIAQMLSQPHLAAWVESGLYVHEILVETPELAAAVQRLLDRTDEAPSAKGPVGVLVVPGPSTLEGALDALAAMELPSGA